MFLSKTFHAFLFCLFIFNLNNLKANDNDSISTTQEWRIGGAILRGKIVEHSPLMAPIIERPATGGEIFLSKQTYGAHHWNRFFNYPDYGVCYTFLDMGSPDYAGIAHCLFPYLNFHFFNNNSLLNLNLRVGTGLAYVEKIYNAETNPLNQAFSTHLNAILNAQLSGVCNLNDHWSFFAGAGIIHLSNGAYQIPNLGMNIVNVFTGISHSFGSNRLITPGSKINEKNKNWDCSVFLSAGAKEIKPIGGNRYFAGDFNVEVTKKHLQYTRFGLSMDFTYDASEYNCIVFQSLPPPADRLRTTRVGVSGGYVLLFGDLSLDAYFGVYLHEENPLYGKVYQRTSLRYPLSDRLKLSLTLRNHKGKADYIGIGFGLRLTK
jgi:hypothetical protein